MSTTVRDAGARVPAPHSPFAHAFSLWAPRASVVELELAGGRHRLEALGDGWFAETGTLWRPGLDYRFCLDGGEPLPDPRSAFQPFGVDGPSRTYDHGAFEWHDASFVGVELAGAVLYELHVGTFTRSGTFEGAIEHLGDLIELGVDAIELMPVVEFSGDAGWGYDGVDLFAPHHAYGGPDGLKRLVDAAHEHGLGVVIDVVYNHLGPAGNYLAAFGPYFTDRHTTNWGDAVNFGDADSGPVREFVLDNVELWLRHYHCDGLRLDAVHAIVDDSALSILEAVPARVHELAGELAKPLFAVAESDRNDPRVVRSPAEGGLGFDAAWADEFHHALHAVLSGERSGYYEDFGPIALLARALEKGWVYAGDYSPHRRRVHGRAPQGLRAEQFVVSLQNHDQVGNRALGERIGEIAGLELAKVGAAIMLCSGFVPMLFQGEEWAASSPFLYFTDHADPDLGAAVSEGRRREFAAFDWAPEDVPDPQAASSFERSKLDWSERAEPAHAEVLRWYRRLIGLRREAAGLAGGPLEASEVDFDEGRRTILYRRCGLGLACNLGAEPVTFELSGEVSVLAASVEKVELGTEGLVVPPLCAAVLALS